MKKRILALVLASAMALSMVACGGASSEPAAPETPAAEASTDAAQAPVADTAGTSSEPTYGGVAKLYFMNLMNEYDPSSPDFMNYQFWYERLFAPDWTQTGDTYSYLDSSNMAGMLAKEWNYDAASQTFTVVLQDGVTFQTLDAAYDYYGGRALTAADVKWSYERLLGIGDFTEPVFSMQDWASTLYMLDSVEVVDDQTVAFHFNMDSDVAVSDFMVAAVNIAGHEWDELTPEQKADWHYACGTGPFVISDYVEGATLKMVKNENYWGHDERYPENQLPYLDGITLTKIQDNATILADFIAGNLDLVGNNENVLSVSEAAQLRDAMAEGTYAEYTNEITNRNICLKQTVKPLQDIRVRQALNYAINMEEIATRYYGLTDWDVPGYFHERTPFNVRDTWTDEMVAAYTGYDPEKAQALLAEAGYPDGFEMTLCYVDDGDSDLILLVQQYLAAVGVTLNLDPKSNQPELQSVVTAENESLGLANAGNVRLGSGLEFWLSTARDYELWGDKENLDPLVTAAQNPTSSQDQIEKVTAVDKYVMENYYLLPITPTQTTSYFASGALGGYAGENIYNAWNASYILARVWKAQ